MKNCIAGNFHEYKFSRRKVFVDLMFVECGIAAFCKHACMRYYVCGTLSENHEHLPMKITWYTVAFLTKTGGYYYRLV